MKNILIAVSIFLVILLCDCNAAEKSTATVETKWPTSASITSVNIKLGGFSFNVPTSGLISLDINDNLPVVAKYKSAKLGLIHESVDSMNRRFESDIFSKTNHHLTDYPKLLFFEPASTQENGDVDTKFLELVSQEKKIRFEGASNLKVFKKDHLIAYLARTNFFSFNYELFLVNEQLPNEFVRITGSNADEKTMEYIVSTFTILNNDKSE